MPFFTDLLDTCSIEIVTFSLLHLGQTILITHNFINLHSIHRTYVLEYNYPLNDMEGKYMNERDREKMLMMLDAICADDEK